MRKKIKIKLLTTCVLLGSLLTISCNDDSIDTPKTELGVVLKTEGLNLTEVDTLNFTIKNRNTGQSKSYKLANGLKDTSKFTLDQGLYQIEINSKATVKKVINDTSNYSNEVKIISVIDEVVLNQATQIIEAETMISSGNQEKGIIISEVYSVKSKTPSGNIYFGDVFIELYNNSNEVQYADGLSVGVSLQKTGDGPPSPYWKWHTDKTETAVAVSSILTIPGSGKEHPIQPGETFVLSDIGMNHKKANANSVDLSKSNFEWYQKLSNDADVDVPEVPNLNVTYTKSKTLVVFSAASNESYILFRMDKAADKFLKDNLVKFKRQFIMDGFNFKAVDYEAYFVPYSLITDAVQTARVNKFISRRIIKSHDLGFASVSSSFSGKSVQRRVAYKVGDRAVLMDSNNSSVDFINDATPTPGTISE